MFLFSREEHEPILDGLYEAFEHEELHEENAVEHGRAESEEMVTQEDVGRLCGRGK